MGSSPQPDAFMQYGTKHYIIGSDTMPEGTDLYDVALSLAKLNRYTGHTNVPYSVAQHSLIVGALVPQHPCVVLYALLHDVAETVVQDLSYPMKQALGPDGLAKFRNLEHQAEAAIFKMIGIRHPIPEHIQKVIKIADWIASATEKRDLLPPCDREWNMLQEPPMFAKIMPVQDWKHVARVWYNTVNATIKACEGLAIPGPDDPMFRPPQRLLPPPPPGISGPLGSMGPPGNYVTHGDGA